MAELSEQGARFVLATVTDVHGSSPRGVGAKMLILADGTTEETIGGGVLESEAIAEARACLASGESYSRTYQLRPEGERALGSLCGGDVTLFFEPHVPARTLFVIGAGHVGQKLCACAGMLDFRVVVLDSRADVVTAQRFPEADELICDDPARAAELCDIGQRTSVVIVTHSAEHDEKALRAVVDSPAAFIGMIGSGTKVRTILARLRDDGVAGERLERIHAPIGLDIGAETPAELALCIMAEIVAKQYGRPGGSMRTSAKRSGAAEGSAP
jgi:xanthine dehydrogenase accessory factor